MRWVSCLAVGGLLVGCTHLDPAPVGLETASLKSTPVSAISQGEDECGPAALAMVLQSRGQSAPVEEISSAVMSRELGGTLGLSLSGEARRRGNVVLPVSDRMALEQALRRGSAPILLLNVGKWTTQWHFVVVVGMHPEADLVYFRSGTQPLVVVTWKEFTRAWQASERWGMEVLRPYDPAPPDLEAAYLDSVIVLEKVGSSEMALDGYRSATHAWPRNLTAWAGRGNTAFAVGKLGEAESAYRHALKLHPEDVRLKTNLKTILRASAE